MRGGHSLLLIISNAVWIVLCDHAGPRNFSIVRAGVRFIGVVASAVMLSMAYWLESSRPAVSLVSPLHGISTVTRELSRVSPAQYPRDDRHRFERYESVARTQASMSQMPHSVSLATAADIVTTPLECRRLSA